MIALKLTVLAFLRFYAMIKTVMKMIKNLEPNAIGKDPLYKTWHASPAHLIMYIHAGQGSIVCADKLYPITPGLLVYIASDTYHYTMPDDPAQYRRSKVFLDPDQLQNLLRPAGLWEAPARALVYAPIPPDVQPQVEGIYTRLQQTQTPLLSAAAVLELMHYLRTYGAESTSSPTGFIGCAIGYINQNIAWDMTLEDICKAANVSKFHLCRRFREHTGMTVMDYILSTRIILAKNELLKTDDSILHISEKCGFSSVSYFCRVFRQRMGCTPLQFRKRGK